MLVAIFLEHYLTKTNSIFLHNLLLISEVLTMPVFKNIFLNFLTTNNKKSQADGKVCALQFDSAFP